MVILMKIEYNINESKTQMSILPSNVFFHVLNKNKNGEYKYKCWKNVYFLFIQFVF